MEQPSPQRVLYGIGKAIDAVPEWHAKQFMKVYDRLFYYSMSKEEKRAADKLRPVLEKRAKVLGWVATGAEVALVSLAAAKGYAYMKNRAATGATLEPVPLPLHEQLPIRVEEPLPHTFIGKTVSVEDKSGPFLLFRGSRTYRANDADYPDLVGKEYPIQFEFITHPLDSDRIIVNIPGIGGTLDGYEAKYAKLARFMQQRKLGAVLRTNNYGVHAFLPDIKARAVLDYAVANAKDICGKAEPDIFVMANSAGAGGVAAIAHEYPLVKRLLLWSPSFDMPKSLVQEGLGKFGGEVTILRGAEDTVLGPLGGKIYAEMAKNASRVESIVIPNCGHHFEGVANGKILSQAPLYAFAREKNRPVFPNPNAGIELYQ